VGSDHNDSDDDSLGKDPINHDSKFDCVICCAGPWINDLEDVNVKPVRGLLLEVDVSDAFMTAASSPSPLPSSSTKDRIEAVGEILETDSQLVPVMEFGYGTEGIHFTLSSRDGALLIGASREGVGFSTTDLDDLEEAIIQHANKFMVPGGIGTITKRRLGFRPACFDKNPGNGRKYWMKRSVFDERIILVYGFEGQGVLYAPLAGMDVMNTYFPM